MSLSKVGREVPVCPMCDGPCTHEFTRSEHRFPDALPKDTPEEPTAPKPNRRGKRMHRPSEDRAHRPSEDR